MLTYTYSGILLCGHTRVVLVILIMVNRMREGELEKKVKIGIVECVTI